MTTPDHIMPPPTPDTGPLETMARAMEPLVNEDMGEPFKSAWLADLASSAITALTEAGYAIVPVAPTEVMLERGLFEAESCTNDWTASAACLPGHVWKAMVRAADTPIDTKEGE